MTITTQNVSKCYAGSRSKCSDMFSSTWNLVEVLEILNLGLNVNPKGQGCEVKNLLISYDLAPGVRCEWLIRRGDYQLGPKLVPTLVSTWTHLVQIWYQLGTNFVPTPCQLCINFRHLHDITGYITSVIMEA